VKVTSFAPDQNAVSIEIGSETVVISQDEHAQVHVNTSDGQHVILGVQEETHFKVLEYKGRKILIDRDELAESPREYQNLGTMVCFHKRYDFPNEISLNQRDFDSWDEMREHLFKKFDAVMVLPLYLMDHSGLQMQTEPFSCQWDSGQVGFIYVSRPEARAEVAGRFLTKNNMEKIKKILTDEVKAYSYYLSGEVYQYEIENGWESCSGILGLEETIADAKEQIDMGEKA